jgi:hypothetical protein
MKYLVRITETITWGYEVEAESKDEARFRVETGQISANSRDSSDYNIEIQEKAAKNESV